MFCIIYRVYTLFNTIRAKRNIKAKLATGLVEDECSSAAMVAEFLHIMI